MASAFGHAILAITIGQNFPKRNLNWKFLTLGILCTILPDADVISFNLGIPYEAFWGHRGFSHSLLFAAMVGLMIVLLFYRRKSVSLEGVSYFVFFSLCTASHSILDAMTNGGLGVAFFSPGTKPDTFSPGGQLKFHQ